MELPADNSGNAKFSRCVDCGAVNPLGVTNCFLCGHKLGANISRDAQGQLARPQPFATGNFATTGSTSTYSLSTLLLYITLAAVCFGLISAAPGLAIPLLILVAPALSNTLTKARAQRAAGGTFSTTAKIRVFIGSVGIILLVIIAGCIAFFAACWAICSSMNNSASTKGSGGSLLFMGIVVGAVVSLVAITRIGNALLRRIK